MSVCQHIVKGDHHRRRADRLIEAARSGETLSSMSCTKKRADGQDGKVGSQQRKRVASQWRTASHNR